MDILYDSYLIANIVYFISTLQLAIHQTTFSMKSVMFMLQISWYIARTSNLATFTDPVPFPKVLVNQGSAWNSTTNKVTIPRTGHYYLHISQGVAEGQNKVYMYTIGMSGNIGLYRYRGSHYGIDTLSRSAIMHITSGTTITVLIYYGCYSDDLLQTSFSGFLLYET